MNINNNKIEQLPASTVLLIVQTDELKGRWAGGNNLNETKEATPGQITNVTGVARATVSQVSTKLLALKKIERIGIGRTTRHRMMR